METTERDIKLERHEYWRGKYRGVSFKIYHQERREMEGYHMPESWCGYIYLPARKLTEENKKRFILPMIESETSPGRWWHHHDYMGLPINCHSGLTYYELHGQVGEKLDGRVAELGWDYMHYWDEGHRYSEQSVMCDCRETIDALLSIAPELEKDEI